MNKQQIKQLVSPKLAILKKINPLIAISQWERAKTLYDIQSMIVWRKSPYKSFKNFCRVELTYIKTSPAISWAGQYGTAHKLNYSWAELKAISQHVSQSTAVNFMYTLKKKMTVQQFIVKAPAIYKTLRQQKANGYTDTSIILRIDTAHQDKFKQLLAPYGYKNVNGRNVHISEAFCKYLDTV